MNSKNRNIIGPSEGPEGPSGSDCCLFLGNVTITTEASSRWRCQNLSRTITSTPPMSSTTSNLPLPPPPATTTVLHVWMTSTASRLALALSTTTMPSSSLTLLTMPRLTSTRMTLHLNLRAFWMTTTITSINLLAELCPVTDMPGYVPPLRATPRTETTLGALNWRVSHEAYLSVSTQLVFHRLDMCNPTKVLLVDGLTQFAMVKFLSPLLSKNFCRRPPKKSFFHSRTRVVE